MAVVVLVWYLFDASQVKGRYTFKRPLSEWKSKPEWFDPQTDATIRNPDKVDETKHHRRTTTLLPEDMTVIVPSFDSERKVGGGFLPSLTNKVDAWLRKQPIDRRTLSRVLSQPLPSEVDGDAKRSSLDAW